MVQSEITNKTAGWINYLLPETFITFQLALHYLKIKSVSGNMSLSSSSVQSFATLSKQLNINMQLKQMLNSF